VEHVGAFAVLGLLFSLNFPRRLALVCFIVFGSVVVLEFLQIFVPERDPRLLDAMEKFGGGAIGVLASYFLLRSRLR
jgi:VanZ family protein